jgi:signal transduction histidine kinase
MDGRCVCCPPHRREGSSLLDNRDDQGRYIMKTLITRSAHPSNKVLPAIAGICPAAGDGRQVAYSRQFAPYGWLIGSGEYIANVEAELQQRALALLASMQLDKDNDDLMVIDNQGVLQLFPANPSCRAATTWRWHRHCASGCWRPCNWAARVALWNTAFLRAKTAPVSHLAYARRLPGWDWTLVNAMHIQSIRDSSIQASTALEGQLLGRIKATLLMTLLAMASAGLLSWFLCAG